MSTVKKLIGSGSLLAAFILSLGLAVPAPCAAASAASFTARDNPGFAATEDPVDLPEILIPKPPPPPPPAHADPRLLASADPVDLPEILIPKPPPPPPAKA